MIDSVAKRIVWSHLSLSRLYKRMFIAQLIPAHDSKAYEPYHSKLLKLNFTCSDRLNSTPIGNMAITHALKLYPDLDCWSAG